MNSGNQVISAFVIGGLCGGLLGSEFALAYEQKNTNSLKTQIKNAVDSGQAPNGFYKCGKTDHSVTSNGQFPSKQVAGDTTLRQLLSVDYDNGICTVQLTP